jgi:hypothetical protein
VAPKLRPGTGFHMRTRSGHSPEARTDRSQWHTVLRWWGGHHLDRADDGEWRDNSGWGVERAAGATFRTGSARAARREDARLAKHAQDLRLEAYAMGGREETQAFFGRGREHVGRGVERRAGRGADVIERAPERGGHAYYTVTYLDAAGVTKTTSVGAYSAGSARRKVDRRPGVATVTGSRRSL